MAKKWIDWESDVGQLMLKQAMNSIHIQPNLISSHVFQKGNTTCGLVSTLIVLNGKITSINDGILTPFNEDQLLANNILQKSVNLNKVKQDGLTLTELSNTLNNLGFKIRTYYACDLNNDTNIFREHCMNILKHKNCDKCIIVNYKMDKIDQSLPFGHFSPIGGYNDEYDSILLLDTWFDDKVCWVKINDIFNAMNTIDTEDARFRGYIIIDKINIDFLKCNVNNRNCIGKIDELIDFIKNDDPFNKYWE